MTRRSSRPFSDLAVAALGLAVLASTSPARADLVVSGALTFDLNGDAFAGGADVAYINAFGQLFNPAFSYDTSQPFMEFAAHGSASAPGRPAPAPTTFSDLRASWVRPATTGLAFGFNGNPALQTLAFDPVTVATTGATGSTRFTGGNSFWFANDSLIAPVDGIPASVWIQYGNLELGFDAARATGDNSGWFFTQQLAGALPVYDIRDLTITVVAAGPGSGSLALGGSLFTAPEFRDFLGIQSGLKVGTFGFSGTTVVPVPAAGWLLVGAIGPLGALRRRQG
jgi:hypothetical protein